MLSKSVKYFILTLVLVLGAFLLGYYCQKPAPVPNKVIENPTKDQQKNADMVTEEKRQGTATGTITIKQNRGQNKPGGSLEGDNTKKMIRGFLGLLRP